MNKYKLIIKADANDADYFTGAVTITQEDLDEVVIPVIECLKAKGESWKSSKEWKDHYNWSGSERRDIFNQYNSKLYQGILGENYKEILDRFEEWLPYDGNWDEAREHIHTIAEVTYILLEQVHQPQFQWDNYRK